MKLRFGTRGSALALAQADLVIRDLRTLRPGIEFERVVIRTSGDRFAENASESGIPIRQALKNEPVNVKAMFVKEIEEALLGGEIDFAVHSSKDLPAAFPDGLLVAAYPKREDPRDVFIPGPCTQKWNHLKNGATLATSSLRRQIQLKMLKPDARMISIYGNIDTRLRKLADGAADGIVLARAGLKRLGRGDIPHEVLPSEIMVPAPGQGALALQTRADADKTIEVLSALDDAKTRLAVECERFVMKAMGGGCRTPLGAFAQQKGEHLELAVFWADSEGQYPIRRHARGAANNQGAEKLAADLAADLLSSRHIKR